MQIKLFTNNALMDHTSDYEESEDNDYFKRTKSAMMKEITYVRRRCIRI